MNEHIERIRSQAERDYPNLPVGAWTENRQEARDIFAAGADAYRTLTADQWESQREKVARALCLANDANPDHIVFSFEHGRDVHEWYTFAIDAGAAMLALGFVRTLDSQP